MIKGIMFSIINAKNGSFEFDEYEKRIVKKLLEYARLNFDKGNGSYLATMNLDKIHFTWCPNMSYLSNLNDDNISNIILGAWSPLFLNTVFIVPNLYSSGFLNYLQNNFKIYDKIITYLNDDQNFKKILKDIKHLNDYSGISNLDIYNLKEIKEYKDCEEVKLDSFINQYFKELLNLFLFNNDFSKDDNIKTILSKELSSNYLNRKIIHKCFVKDYIKFSKIKYFFNELYFDEIKKEERIDDADQMQMILTICHELYHRWQFTAFPIMPIFYIINFFVSLFFGYEASSKSKWLIEGDVRIYVDNKKNALKFIKIHNALEYIKRVGNIFFIEHHLFNNLMEKAELIQKIRFNKLFTNKFNINDLKKKYMNKEWFKNELKDSFLSYELNKTDEERLNDEKNCEEIKNTYEYNFILKFLKDEDLLTEEFIKYLEKI